MKDTRRMIQAIVTIAMLGFFLYEVRLLFTIDPERLSLPVVFNISVGLISLLGYSVLSLIQMTDNTSQEKRAQLFWLLIVMGYLGIIFDNLSWSLDGAAPDRTLNFALSLCSFLIMPILLVVYWNYQNYVFIGESTLSSKTKGIVNSLAVVDIVYIFIGTATGYLFSIDEYGRYSDGDGFIFVLIYPVIAISCCIFENLRRSLPITKKLSLLSFGVIPLITIALQIPFQPYSFLYVALFMDLILIYGIVQSKQGVELAEKNAALAEQNQVLLEQKTQIMISQIQPHFLYNTLAAIYQLCDMDTRQAQRMILAFSDYLRSNMDSIKSTAPIPFERELAHTKTYLEIELLRFSNILKVEYDIAATDFKIPALTLQPLVENAVRYGIRSREDGGTVTISSRREDGRIIVCVRDDGMGFDVTEQKQDGKSHVGIENTRSRLQLMVNGELVIESRIGEGTTATIMMEG